MSSATIWLTGSRRNAETSLAPHHTRSVWQRLAIAAIVPPLHTQYGQIHILKEPKGARPFDEMRERALLVDLGGNDVAIVSLDDLIRMKRAAGRPGDLDDIATLTEVERQRQDNS